VLASFAGAGMPDQCWWLQSFAAADVQPLLQFGDPMKLRPLHDRVIVKRIENETKTASGIVIPDSAAEKPDQGEILAVGPGKANDKGEVKALGVKVGDRVLFGKYSGQTVQVDGDELLVMKEEDLFAVVEK
jgi:chaperonin GroES